MSEDRYGYRPRSLNDLTAYITEQLEREHDYNTAVEATTNVSVAAFNYAARVLGITGFQSSCADLGILRLTRGLDGPFGLLDGEQLLYPQYDLVAKAEEWVEKWKPELAAKAQKRLEAQNDAGFPAHPNVVERWRELAALRSGNA